MRRLVFKFALLLAPAVLLSAAAGVWGDSMRRFGYDVFSRKGYTVEIGGHRLDLPDKSWEQPVWALFQDFRNRFITENPVRIADARDGRLEHPLKPLTQPLTITLTTAEAFRTEAIVETGSSLPRNGGYFNARKAKIIIDADDETKQTVARALTHEMTHAIMHFSYSVDPAWPAWLSEGFAQWCEIEGVDQSLGSGTVKQLRDARHSLKEEGCLARLLRSTPGDYAGPDNAWYYRGACALVTFLIEQMRPGFIAYFDAEAAPGTQHESLFREKIGEPAEIEKRFLQWLRP